MPSKKLIILSGILLTSCVSEDAAPVIAALDYRLVCNPATGCAGRENMPARTVKRGIDGQDNLRVGCYMGDRLADLALDFNGSGYGFSVNSSAPNSSSNCSVSIAEGNNTYEKTGCEISRGGEADCSESAAADYDENVDEMPCQISVKTEGTTVTGTICCRNIPEEYKAAQGNEYSLALSQDMSKPARFEFTNCK